MPALLLPTIRSSRPSPLTSPAPLTDEPKSSPSISPLLFFGNFHKMSLTDFEWAINEMMNDKDYIYSALTKDLYFLGLVLDRKYRILRITYTVFMIGIITSVLAFAIFFKMQETTKVIIT